MTPKSNPTGGNGQRVPVAEWRPAFLAALRNSANVRAACQAAGISREHAYNSREQSAEFRTEWERALADACDVLEAEARRRAMSTSDVLLIFLLKSHRPEVYRETVRQEHSGPGGGPLQVEQRQVVELVWEDSRLDQDGAATAEAHASGDGNGS